RPYIRLRLLRLVFQGPGHPRDLPSFPTRRSSDLPACPGPAFEGRQAQARRGVGELRSDEGEPFRPAGDDVLDREADADLVVDPEDRKSTRLNSSHVKISYAVFCLKKKKIIKT